MKQQSRNEKLQKPRPRLLPRALLLEDLQQALQWADLPGALQLAVLLGAHRLGHPRITHRDNHQALPPAVWPQHFKPEDKVYKTQIKPTTRTKC